MVEAGTVNVQPAHEVEYVNPGARVSASGVPDDTRGRGAHCGGARQTCSWDQAPSVSLTTPVVEAPTVVKCVHPAPVSAPPVSVTTPATEAFDRLAKDGHP